MFSCGEESVPESGMPCQRCGTVHFKAQSQSGLPEDEYFSVTSEDIAQLLTDYKQRCGVYANSREEDEARIEKIDRAIKAVRKNRITPITICQSQS